MTILKRGKWSVMLGDNCGFPRGCSHLMLISRQLTLNQASLNSCSVQQKGKNNIQETFYKQENQLQEKQQIFTVPFKF